MAQNNKFAKTLKRFNTAGLIHTLISVSVFVMSLLNYLYEKTIFYYTIEVLSIVTLVNSIIWLACAIILILVAKELNNPTSVSQTRKILGVSMVFVLWPDIIMVIIFFLPFLQANPLINIAGVVSPVMVFIGWFIGKHMGKKLVK